jgi:hypothetical protein
MILLYTRTQTDALRNNDYRGKEFIHAAIALGELVGIPCGIDRTNLFPNALNVRRLGMPAVNFDGSFSEAMSVMASAIHNMDGDKVVMWSGGLDSTAIIVALMNIHAAQDFEIVLTQESIAEYPAFYEKVVKLLRHRIVTAPTWVDALLNQLPHKVITGHGHSIPIYDKLKHPEIELDANWTELLAVLPNEESRVMLSAHVAAAPVQISSVDDAYWYIRLVFEAHQTTYRMSMITEDPKDGQKFIPFYGSDVYQSWEINNRNLIRLKSIRSSATRIKNNLRQYILDFNGDDAYATTKEKINSPKVAFGSAVLPFRRDVLFDDYRKTRLNQVFRSAAPEAEATT